jgi:hypothetical protein
MSFRYGFVQPAGLVAERSERLSLDNIHEWQASEEGKANFRERAVRASNFVLAPDGSFAIDDLGPATTR